MTTVRVEFIQGSERRFCSSQDEFVLQIVARVTKYQLGFGAAGKGGCLVRWHLGCSKGDGQEPCFALYSCLLVQHWFIHFSIWQSFPSTLHPLSARYFIKRHGNVVIQ